MIEIKRGSIEERVLKILMNCYPITISELRRYMGISEDKLMRVVKSLEVRGIVGLDVLPDKIYIRLLRHDLHFIGRKETQRKAFKRTRGRGYGKSKGIAEADEEPDKDIMYA
jgi:hypothetical protein